MKKDNVKLFGAVEISRTGSRNFHIKKLKRIAVEQLLADESVWEIIDKTGLVPAADPLESQVVVKLSVLVPGGEK